MAKNRDLQLERYGISKMAYRELAYFCLQYGEKQKIAKTVSSPQKREAMLRDISMIEDAAREAAPDFCGALLQNVTAKVPYERLEVPCGRRQFYSARRRFFFLLSKKREM